jgi:D-sedoheptulose 7-phosphate isomerase
LNQKEPEFRRWNSTKAVESSLDESIESLRRLKELAPELEKLAEIISEARDHDHCVFTFGNGGSGSTAVHFASDLMKTTIKKGKKRIRSVCLNSNMPLVTAWANDSAYENVFKEQLENLMNKGDVVLAISGSGNSKNILKAVEYAQENGAVTVGLTGFDGGVLKEKVTIPIVVPSHDMMRIEDVHLLICHVLVRLISEN